MTKNLVNATGVSGIYKDKSIELRIGPDAASSELFVDGKKLKNLCIGAWIKIRPGHPTKLFLEFTKFE